MAEHASKPGLQRAVLRPTRSRRRFDEGRAQPAVTLARPARLVLAGALVVAGTERRPTREMGRCRKRTHVDADLGENHLGRPAVDAWNAIQPGQLVGKRDEMPFDLEAQGADRLVQVVEVGQQLSHEKRVVRPKAAGQRRASAGSLPRNRPRASSAKTRGSVVPCASASSMARPDTPKMSLATVASLTPASSSALWRRFATRVRSWMRALR